jgi:hypothetical protein
MAACVQEDGSGYMCDAKGGVLRQWDVHGTVVVDKSDGDTGTLATGKFDADSGNVLLQADGAGCIGVAYNILSRSLQIWMKTDGVHFRFVQGWNEPGVRTAVSLPPPRCAVVVTSRCVLWQPEQCLPKGCDLFGNPGADTAGECVCARASLSLSLSLCVCVCVCACVCVRGGRASVVPQSIVVPVAKGHC